MRGTGKILPFRGADFDVAGGLLPFQGAGSQVGKAPKRRNGVAIKPLILAVQWMSSPSKWK
ncbi:hypothetical protein F8275_00050 [Bifidobacterium breve]|nr:hypothetical protein EGX97_09600 [Bifidobacterium breve]KAB1934299.1 hypothetical protein F8275_00050 [Bifidobacterium breve]MED7617803.1 hypothetical protein [Bifidobacterium breve]PVV76445.1 hypothetical protein DD700_02355 [Bifidobacterium breve]